LWFTQHAGPLPGYAVESYAVCFPAWTLFRLTGFRPRNRYVSSASVGIVLPEHNAVRWRDRQSIFEISLSPYDRCLQRLRGLPKTRV